MQEIVLVLGSVAGACTAVALDKFPVRKNVSGERTASPSYSSNTLSNQSVQKQISSLEMEKEILNKTIYRLSSQENNISSEQKNALLAKYQQQVADVTSKIDNLRYPSSNSQVNLIGENLVTLIDQKLSSLDKRLGEISSKMTEMSQLQQQQEQQDKTETPIEKEEKPVQEVGTKEHYLSDDYKTSSGGLVPVSPPTPSGLTRYNKENLVSQYQEQKEIEKESAQKVRPAVAASTSTTTTKEKVKSQNIQQKIRPSHWNLPKQDRKSVELITLTEIPHRRRYQYYESSTNNNTGTSIASSASTSNTPATTPDSTPKSTIAQTQQDSKYNTKPQIVSNPKTAQPEKNQDQSSRSSLASSPVPTNIETKDTASNEKYDATRKEKPESTDIQDLQTQIEPATLQQNQRSTQADTDTSQQGEEDEEIDINSLKKEIMNTLSKLDQVEVE